MVIPEAWNVRQPQDFPVIPTPQTVYKKARFQEEIPSPIKIIQNSWKASEADNYSIDGFSVSVIDDTIDAYIQSSIDRFEEDITSFTVDDIQFTGVVDQFVSVGTVRDTGSGFVPEFFVRVGFPTTGYRFQFNSPLGGSNLSGVIPAVTPSAGDIIVFNFVGQDLYVSINGQYYSWDGVAGSVPVANGDPSAGLNPSGTVTVGRYYVETINNSGVPCAFNLTADFPTKEEGTFNII